MSRRQPNPALGEVEIARAVLDIARGWDEVQAPARGRPGAHAQLTIKLSLPSGRPQLCWLLPVPGCPTCGALQRGGDRALTSAALGLADGGPRLRSAGRAASLGSVGATLDRYAVDSLTGLVRGTECLSEDWLGNLVLGTAWAAGQDLVRGRTFELEWSSGVAGTAEQARTVAALEALERYASARPRGLHLELASADDLGGQALDPRSLLLHSTEQYRTAGFPYVPFDPAGRRYWSWAYSVAEERQVAVPADLVFYRLGRASQPGGPPVKPLAQSTSSGCAIGSSPAEAALYGLLEIVERDAFLVAWHRRKPLPQLDLADVSNPRVQHLIGLLRAEGYRCLAFDISVPDVQVPSVWAMAVRTAGTGLQSLSGACSHPLPEQALRGALEEVAGRLRPMQRLYESRHCWAQRALADPSLIRSPLDHALAYGPVEAMARLDFLFQQSSRRSLRELAASSESVFGKEAWRWTGALCGQLIRAGFDVLFADLTPSDVRGLGLTVLRALVPGLLPITFGHGRERLAGTHRAGTDWRSSWPHPLG